ncbi:DUF1329 domain-containing protein [Pseudomonas sp. KCA11]|uniref:DUF1329 domain-containing protein n=1 Tax=Pseudomonas sp. TaxID=306 RepID=UPI001F200DA8|nr:DUF1329 domain-containing protein [Pseudomonas sp. KCA11]MCE5990655.1 DUF1329 domain-containing protein [Pseudomonas sp. KCA11]
MPFPVPRCGLELLKNASTFTLLAWTAEYTSDNAYVLRDGNINWPGASLNICNGLKEAVHD